MDILFLILGLLAGAIIGWLTAKVKGSGGQDNQAMVQRLEIQSAERERLEEFLTKERERSGSLSESLATAEAEMRHLQERLDHERSELTQLEKRFKTEFENVASKLLEEKAQKFTEHNRASMDVILGPLREKIGSFEKTIEDRYVMEMKDKESLRVEVKKLFELNAQISQEAQNLTLALKGDNKQQGNWGEVILERVLERSGLQRGSEFEMQVSMSNDDGERIQPDAIIYLPEGKHIVIDSKVSLIAFEAMVNATDEIERTVSAKAHIRSVRAHIAGLSERRYYHGSGLSAPEMTLLFMPIEASFGAALQQDVELFTYAWDRQVVLVSPSTLLATLRTVASIWKHDRQTKNAIEIATESGKLYDKFVSFVDDMNRVGAQLNKSRECWEGAVNKLSTGRGNLIERVEKVRTLGAKTTKQLDTNMSSEQP